MRPTIPAEILSLGHARAAARRAHDFREADRIKTQIEAAGYKVVDRGRDFTLSPAHPEDVVSEDGQVRYGWSGAVPSALETPPTATATVLLVADGGPEPLRRTLDGLREHVPAGTQVVIVAAPDPTLDEALTADELLTPVAGAVPEVVRTARHFRPAAARNAGMRRAAGSVVIWIATGSWISGDVVSPVVAALADETVAVAGAVALRASDVRRLTPGPAGDADAIDRTLLGFRRDELTTLGMLDEHHFTDDQLDRWWSLVLRDGPDLEDEDDEAATDIGAAPFDDEDEDEDDEEAADADAADETDDGAEDDEDDAEDEPWWTPRRAVALDLPIDGTTAVAPWIEPVEPRELARRQKRDLYRLIDRFTGRPELLSPRNITS